MLNKIKKFLGYAWAAPVTLPGLAYVVIFTILGWYSWYGQLGDAIIWTINIDKSPSWLLSLWERWAGHTIGNVVVLKSFPEEKPVILTHEQKHVDQCMRLGIFQPIFYAMNMLSIKLGCSGSDPYYDNSFEIDARRHAGQLIDIAGSKKKS